MTDRSKLSGHTPTPWALVAGPKSRGAIKSVCKGFPQNLVAQASGQATTEEREANAALIVHAVNNHAALVEALEGAATTLWACGRNAEARKIDRLLDRVAPEAILSMEAIG